MIYIRNFFRNFAGMKHYFIASTLIFAVGIYFGFTSVPLRHYLNDQIDGLSQIAKKISEQEHSQLLLFLFIFLNNLFKSIFVLVAGSFFCLLPIYFLLLNGMVLGHVAWMDYHDGNNVWLMLIKGILPHGIIELPAIIIACAYGIRFGVLVLKALFQIFVPGKRESAGKAFVSFFIDSAVLVGFLSILLFIAAVIESTLTVWLLR